MELVDARLHEGYIFVEECDPAARARRRSHTENDLALMRRTHPRACRRR